MLMGKTPIIKLININEIVGINLKLKRYQGPFSLNFFIITDFFFKNLLLTKSAKKYLDSKKHIQAPSVEAKDTKITPSTTPNKAPAARVKTPGKNGKDNPAKMMYEMKKTNLDNTISLLAHIMNQLTFCFKLSKFKIS